MNDSTDQFEEYKKTPDAQSLARLLQHHQEPVLRICRSVLGHPQDAEDACQEVLLEVSRQARSIEAPGAFSTWLYRTALHTALDHRRKRGRDRLRDHRANAPGPTQISRDLNETLYEGLERLDEPSRALIVEHYLAGRPLRELAAERGCSEVAIWKRLRSVRERLRSTIGSAAMASLGITWSDRIPWSLWGRWVSLTGGSSLGAIPWAITVPVGISAVIGLVLLARPAPSPAPEPPKKEAAGGARLPRLAQAPPVPPPLTAPVLPATSPQGAGPKVFSPRKPYPHKVAVPGAPGGAVWAWSVVSRARVTIDEKDISLEQFLAALSRPTGLRFKLDPDLPKTTVTIKVSEIVVDGALRLMLGPSQMDYQIEPDGSVRVGRLEDIKGGYERTAREAEAPLHELAYVATMMDGGWDGLRNPLDQSPKIEAALARKIVLPQGETTLEKEVDRLAKAEAIHVLWDGDPVGNPEDPRPAKKIPFLEAVEERSLGTHLEQLAKRAGLVLVSNAEDIFFLTTPEKASELRATADAERATYTSSLKVLSTSLPDGSTLSIQDFAESVQAARSIPVIPSEEAWNCSVSISLPSGSTVRQGLDAFKAQGFRWALYDGKLFILK